jgi:predicted RNase H-like HicB family nuclease
MLISTLFFGILFIMKKEVLKHKKISKKVYNYTAVFESDKKVGGYTVTIPNLPGCISEGDTFEEALKNIKDAASLYLEVMKEHNTKIFQDNLGVIITPIQVMA